MSFFDNIKRVFFGNPYTTDGMKDAWQSGIKASADYYDRMSQYNKDTRGMTRQDRNTYYRDRNKEDGWFDRLNN